MFEPHQRHCIVVIEQDTFTLAKYWFNPGRPILVLAERLLMGRKESNQTNKKTDTWTFFPRNKVSSFSVICCFILFIMKKQICGT